MTTEAYFVPQMKVRLFSPQAHIIEQDEKGCGLTLTHPAKELRFVWEKGKEMTIPIHPATRLFIAKGHPPGKVDTTGGVTNVCVTDESNVNLSVMQKCLMRWHFRLGHLGFSSI
ncbi:MAG: GAG-pre-integrase domain-containing protein, partial [Gaiellaceae bacterium]